MLEGKTYYYLLILIIILQSFTWC